MFDNSFGNPLDNSSDNSKPGGNSGPAGGLSSQRSSGFRIYVVVSSLAFLLVGLYLGWVFFSRWQQNKAIEEKSATQQRLKAQQDFEMMGGNRFEILAFSAVPPSIQAGDTATLCYSVSNAKSVKLDPQSQPISPGVFRCVQVSPRKTTTYTLTAEDAAGHAKTATVEIQVH